MRNPRPASMQLAICLLLSFASHADPAMEGTWDEGRDDPPALAKAELKKDTGVIAASMLHVGRLMRAYGFCTQGDNVFLAQDLEHMIRTAAIVDGSTAAAMGLLRLEGWR